MTEGFSGADLAEICQRAIQLAISQTVEFMVVDLIHPPVVPHYRTTSITHTGLTRVYKMIFYYSHATFLT